MFPLSPVTFSYIAVPTTPPSVVQLEEGAISVTSIC